MANRTKCDKVSKFDLCPPELLHHFPKLVQYFCYLVIDKGTVSIEEVSDGLVSEDETKICGLSVCAGE